MEDLVFELDRALFFSIGRVLQRGIGKRNLGKITLAFGAGELVVDSEWGGGRIPCTGAGAATVELSAKAFCGLITTRSREKAPAGLMRLELRPQLGEVAIDRAGMKAKFL